MSTKRSMVDSHAGSHGGSKASHSSFAQVDAVANSPSLETNTAVHGSVIRGAVDVHATTIVDRESNGALKNNNTIENKSSSSESCTIVASGTEGSSSRESRKERSGPEMQATSLTLAVEVLKILNNKQECGGTSSSPFPVAALTRDAHDSKKRRRGRGNSWIHRKSHRIKAKADCLVQVGDIKSPPTELLRKASAENHKSVCNLMQLAEVACVSEEAPLKGDGNKAVAKLSATRAKRKRDEEEIKLDDGTPDLIDIEQLRRFSRRRVNEPTTIESAAVYSGSILPAELANKQGPKWRTEQFEALSEYPLKSFRSVTPAFPCKIWSEVQDEVKVKATFEISALRGTLAKEESMSPPFMSHPFSWPVPRTAEEYPSSSWATSRSRTDLLWWSQSGPVPPPTSHREVEPTDFINEYDMDVNDELEITEHEGQNR